MTIKRKSKARKKPAKTNAQIREIVSNKIADAMEAGINPWRKPWKDGVGPQMQDMPQNAQAGNYYRGANVPHLLAVAGLEGYRSNSWVSYRQAKKLGGTVRKGEKATIVVFAKPIRFKDKEPDENGNDQFKQIFMLRTSPVFNIDQCDDIELPEREPYTEREATDIEKLVLDTMHATGADIRFGGDRAFYRPSADFIQLPVLEAFKTIEGFAGTALHELIHWTGSEKRLARIKGSSFGSPEYAREELVAEFGAAMLCHRLELVGEIEQHASYLENWAKVVRKDSQAIFKASHLAECACDLITGRKEELAIAA